MGRQNEAKLVILENLRRCAKARPLSLFCGPQSSLTLCGHMLSLSVPKTCILRMHLQNAHFWSSLEPLFDHRHIKPRPQSRRTNRHNVHEMVVVLSSNQVTNTFEPAQQENQVRALARTQIPVCVYIYIYIVHA